jgi:SAM-dependent methyltransferase
MGDNCIYDFSYYEGQFCNYGAYGGYTGKIMRLSRFLVFRKSLSMIRKYKISGKALDIGCAYGYLADYLSRHGFSSTGCDISEYALQVASGMFPHVKTFRADIDNGFSLPEEEFDVITAFEVLEHCRNLDNIAEKVARSLRPGGVFLISVPDSDMVPPEKQGDETHVSFLNTRGWVDVFSRHGMECVEKTYYPVLFRKIRPYWGTNLILFRKQI